MKHSLSLDEINVGTLIDRSRRTVVLGGVLLAGALSLTSCSDEKICSDTDVSADPAARFDLGLGQDPSDNGISDFDTGSADPVGAGFRCSDFD